MRPLLYRNRFRVPSTRMRGWDYRGAGAYGVTICVQGRVCCLGKVEEGQIVRSPFGEIVEEEWRRIPEVHPHVLLDEWIVMPDHIHGILFFEPVKVGSAEGTLAAGSLGAVVGQLKKRSTKRIRAQRHSVFTWQERFFDQILKDDEAVERYRVYIRENPIRWHARASLAG
jgi:putative transposase